MTYYESAEGVTITRKRAMQELQKHGVFHQIDLDDFDATVGIRETYTAHEVLQWLGY